MLTTRVYRPARPAYEALAELRRMAGSQFCPRCVTALEAIVGIGPAADASLPAPAGTAAELVAS
jgi:HD-GYP domain-containing protein (c-di-GMP phosphodiesterase class II)